MEQLLKTWKLRMVKYRQEADNANSPITKVKAMNKFFILRDCIKELEQQLTITGVVVSEACKCDKPLPYELMPFKCHNCSGEIKKSETELVCFETSKRCTKGSTYYCKRLCVGKVLKTN